MITMTIDTIELYRRATDEFAARVRLIGARWTAATPCIDWDVRALLHHIVEEELWAPPLFAGRTIGEVGDSLSGDLLGDHPVRTFEQASAAAVEAVLSPSVMERPAGRHGEHQRVVGVRSQTGHQRAGLTQFLPDCGDLAMDAAGTAGVRQNASPVGLGSEMERAPMPVLDHVGATRD
jgi:Mycothiol maleylpyruvate isomerase N-terminal domain